MIIVLAGAAGSGKDTIGDLLVASHGFVKDAFASPLKAMVRMAFPAFDDNDIYGPSSRRETQYPQYPFTGICLGCGTACHDAKAFVGGLDVAWWKNPEKNRYHCENCEIDYPEFISPRIALQTLGTEWGRRLFPPIWVDAAFARIRRETEEYGRSTFNPGVELDYIITDCRFKNEIEGSKKNGGIVVRLTRNKNNNTSAHASEAELRSLPDSMFDYIFDNEKMALEELPVEVGGMLRDLKRMTKEKT